jgi:hypothetical protein
MNTTTADNQAGQDQALVPATQQAGAVEQQRQERKPMRMGSTGIDLQTFVDLWNFANVIATSGMAPKGITSREAITVAIQMGLEVGLPPMAALQNIAVINGRPSIWGDAQLGIVRTTGQLERYEEAETNNASDLVFRELCLTDDPQQKKTLRLQLAKAQASHAKNADDFGVTVFVQRRGYEPVFGRFTVSDAKQAKLWGKEGPWTNYPPRMLKFRARSFALRDQFGDALKGLLSAEEAHDLPPTVVTSQPILGTVSSQPMLSAPQIHTTAAEPMQPVREPEPKGEKVPAQTSTQPAFELAAQPAKTDRKRNPSKKELAMEYLLEPSRKDRWGVIHQILIEQEVPGADSAATADDFCNNMSEESAGWIVAQSAVLDATLNKQEAK